MERAILFRFHKKLDVCRNRLELLRKYNPDTPIFGLGSRNTMREARAKLADYLDEMDFAEEGSSRHQWINGDLVIRKWFIDYGRKRSFDMLYDVHWDLLLFAPISVVYKRVHADGVGLTGLQPLSKVEKVWDWTKGGVLRGRYLKMLSEAKRRFGYKQQPYGCIGPGMCFSREFLERYSKAKPIVSVHDELRVPLFCQILGVRMYDTGFYGEWYDKKAELTFNALRHEIKLGRIKKELSRRGGKRVFHPYYHSIDTSLS